MKTKGKAFKVRKLYMVHDQDELCEQLYMQRGVYPHERPARHDDETLEALADMLDLHAENCNAHDFVPLHGAMAVILLQECGRKTATRVMRRLANYAGLHGMMGWSALRSKPLAEKELGVSLNCCPIGRNRI